MSKKKRSTFRRGRRECVPPVTTPKIDKLIGIPTPALLDFRTVKNAMRTAIMRFLREKGKTR